MIESTAPTARDRSTTPLLGGIMIDILKSLKAAVLLGAGLLLFAACVGLFTVDPDTGQPAEFYITAFEFEGWETIRATAGGTW